MSQMQESIHELPLIFGAPPKFIFSHRNDILEYSIKKQHLILIRKVDSFEDENEISIQNLESGIIVACFNYESYVYFYFYDLSPNLQYFVCSSETKEDQVTIRISNLECGTSQFIDCSEIYALKTYFDYFAILKSKYQMTIYNYYGETIRNLQIKAFCIESDHYVVQPYKISEALIRLFLLINSKKLILKKIFLFVDNDFILDLHLQNSNILVFTKVDYLNCELLQKIICLKHNNSGKILRTMRLIQRFKSFDLFENTQQTVQISSYITTSFSEKIYLIDYTTGIEKMIQEKMDESVETFEGEFYAIKNDDSINIWSKEQLIKMIF